MSSNHIYPYVYRGDHPITGEFYIGYRCANKHPAETDLGVHYKTSSDIVKNRFCEFKWTIIAIFFTREDAYDFEQSLIKEEWDDPLILNQSVRTDDSIRFMTPVGYHHSKETIEKMKAAKVDYVPWNAGVPMREDLKQSLSAARKGIPLSEETRKKMSDSSKGKVHSKETKKKMSDNRKGIPLSESAKQKLREINSGKIAAFDIVDKVNVQVSSDEFHSNDRYIGANSKIAKAMRSALD